MKCCRICSSEKVFEVGSFRPYLDRAFVVYDCSECGCRFTETDECVYEKMHSSAPSVYCSHRYAEDNASKNFKNGPLELRKHLCRTLKNRFVIESIESESNIRSILEVGCSRGYLTAYFILKGYDILGTDIAESAVASAARAFGDHFAVYGRVDLSTMGPFDAAYHVGTIGCVESPIDMTRELLSLLRPGGILLFNSPDVEACREMGGIWIAGAAPPDLVTLFDKEFWLKYFGDLAEVSVSFEPFNGYGNAMKVFCRLLGRPYLKEPHRKFLENEEAVGGYSIRRLMPGRVREMIRSGIGAIGSARIFPRYSTELGIYVAMRKR